MISTGSAARPTQAETHRHWRWRLSGAGLAACIGLTALIGKQAEQAAPAVAQGTTIGGTAVILSDAATTDASTGQAVDFVCAKPTCVILFADPNGQITPLPVAASAPTTATTSGQTVPAPVVQTRTRASR